MSSTVWTKFSPHWGADAGCSHWTTGPWIQLTWGSVPAVTSAIRSAGYEGSPGPLSWAEPALVDVGVGVGLEVGQAG
jgi:hypothetical protein